MKKMNRVRDGSIGLVIMLMLESGISPIQVLENINMTKMGVSFLIQTKMGFLMVMVISKSIMEIFPIWKKMPMVTVSMTFRILMCVITAMTLGEIGSQILISH